MCAISLRCPLERSRFASALPSKEHICCRIDVNGHENVCIAFGCDGQGCRSFSVEPIPAKSLVFTRRGRWIWPDGYSLYISPKNGKRRTRIQRILANMFTHRFLLRTRNLKCFARAEALRHKILKLNHRNQNRIN